MLVADTKPNELVLIDTVGRLNIRVIARAADGTDVYVDATSLKFTLRDGCRRIIYQDDFFSPPTPPGVTRIVHPSVGHYYFPLGDQTLFPLTPGGQPNRETSSVGKLYATWQVVGPPNSELVVQVQNVQIISEHTACLMNSLRLQIDKALKTVNDDPNNPCFLGYTDAMLLEFLNGGLSTWNLYEPYPTFCTIDDFPYIYEQGLIEAALLVGTMTQDLFAIDTDIPNYSAQGAAFVIQHQPGLAQYLTFLSQRLDKIIPIAKLKLTRAGTLHVEAAPNFRLQTLLSSAPNGALFRNTFVAGG